MLETCGPGRDLSTRPWTGASVNELRDNGGASCPTTCTIPGPTISTGKA